MNLTRRAMRMAGAVMVLAGVGATLPALSQGTAAGSTAKKQVNLAFFGYSAANAYTQAALLGVKDVAKKYGASVTVYTPTATATKQEAQVEDAATSGKFNGMVVYSVSGDAVVPGVKEAIAKGIKVVADFVAIGPTINAIKPQVKGLSGSVIAPIDETGTASGDLVVKACTGIDPCHVVYLTGTAKLPLTVDRTDHFMAVIKKHANIHIVGTITGGYTSSKGYAAGEDALSAHPTVNVIASPADQAIVGVEEAVKQAGDLKKVKLIGGGGTYQAIAGLKSGDWFGTVNYCPTREAERATRIDIQAVLGQKVKQPYVNSLTLCGAPLELTKSNVGSYKGEWTAG